VNKIGFFLLFKCMRIVTTSGTRSINVVLRHLGASNNYDIVITNEGNKEEGLIQVSVTEQEINDNMRQLNIPIDSTYPEGTELSFYVVETGEIEVLHRNKIYVTDK